jgi:SAM-dependent methyltransferase
MRTMEELKGQIRIEIKNNSLLERIRRFNHLMIDHLNKARSLRGCSMLDIGGSTHGYALEAALERKGVTYEGINLSVEGFWKSSVVEFQNKNGSIGRLRQMDAEHLAFPDCTFDCLLTASTFEHFLQPGVVLAEMHRVLRPGGVALVSFDGVWSCSYGYHLLQFPELDVLVPPWSHLFLNKDQLRQVLSRRPWPANAPLSLEEALEWIYEDQDINRLSITQLRRYFEKSPFEIDRISPYIDERLDELRSVAEYLSKILPYTAEELLTRGLSIKMRKR